MIESKQRQLEAQERLIAEMLHFAPQSVAEPVTDELKVSDKSHIPDEVAHRVSGTQYDSTHPSASVTDIASKPISLVSSSSYNRASAKEVVRSAVSVYSQPSVESGLPLVLGHDQVLADREVGSNVRLYQEELLQRQTDRQHALLEARRRLQMRAEQLLDSGINLLSESPSKKHRSLGHSQSLTAPFEQSDAHGLESRGVSHLSESDVLHGLNRDVLAAQVEVSKLYRPELYQPKSLTEDVEAFEYTAAAASPGDGDGTDDERQFVTPELKEDGRVRPYRVAEYSPPLSPQASDTAHKSQQLLMSSGHSIIQSSSDDFNLLILQAQRELEVRQQQMQDQFEALENEERRLAEHQFQINSQIGHFPSKIQALMMDTIYSQQPTAVLDSHVSSSSDLAVVADGTSPSLSARNTPVVSRDNFCHPLPSASKENLDISGLRSDHKGRIAVDSTSSQMESHQIHLSHSAPLLLSHNDTSVHYEQLPPPVSITFGIVDAVWVHKELNSALNET